MNKRIKILIKQFIILEIIILAITMVTTVAFVFQHEQTHVQIYNRYGYNASIRWGIIYSYAYPTAATRNITDLDTWTMNVMNQELEIAAINTKTNILLMCGLSNIILLIGSFFEMTRLERVIRPGAPEKALERITD